MSSLPLGIWSFRCPCGRHLSKVDPESTVRCTCGLIWGPEESQETMKTKEKRKR